MNSVEHQMLSTLEKLKGSFNVSSVKAEFEAEGTRPDDLMRLTDLVRRANLGLTIKIGGCEAVRDLIECKQLGVDRIVAPMIETEYALRKFILAKEEVFTDDEREDVEFLMNLETISAFDNSDAIIKLCKEGLISGLVFGRVDFCGSINLTRLGVNSDEVLDYCIKVAKKCKENDLQFIMGGGVSADSEDFLRNVASMHLSRFETRKIVFDSEVLMKDLNEAIHYAVKFELLYLTNKRDYYSAVSIEDNSRIEMLKKRLALFKP